MGFCSRRGNSSDDESFGSDLRGIDQLVEDRREVEELDRRLLQQGGLDYAVLSRSRGANGSHDYILLSDPI